MPYTHDAFSMRPFVVNAIWIFFIRCQETVVKIPKTLIIWKESKIICLFRRWLFSKLCLCLRLFWIRKIQHGLDERDLIERRNVFAFLAYAHTYDSNSITRTCTHTRATTQTHGQFGASNVKIDCWSMQWTAMFRYFNCTPYLLV